MIFSAPTTIKTMPRKQTFQCLACKEVFRDNYRLQRHLARKKPCTGITTKVAKKVGKRPKGKVTAAEFVQHIDELQQAEQQDPVMLDDTQLDQLQMLYNQGVQGLHRTGEKQFNDILDHNASMVNILTEAAKYDALPPVEDVNSLVESLAAELKAKHPKIDLQDSDIQQQLVDTALEIVNRQYVAFYNALQETQDVTQANAAVYDFYKNRDTLQYLETIDSRRNNWNYVITFISSALSASLGYNLYGTLSTPLLSLAGWFGGFNTSWFAYAFNWAPPIITGAAGALFSSVAGVFQLLSSSALLASTVLGVLSFLLLMVVLRLIFSTRSISTLVGRSVFENKIGFLGKFRTCGRLYAAPGSCC